MQHPVHVRLAVRTAQSLQHLAHVQLAVRASNDIDTPPVNPTHCQNRDIDLPTATNTSYLQRSSSCTFTTQPISATRNDCPAAFNNSTDLSFPQRSSSCIQQLDRHQLPATIILLHLTTRLTSATSNDRLAASLRLDHTSHQHHPSSWRQIQLPRTLHTRL